MSIEDRGTGARRCAACALLPTDRQLHELTRLRRVQTARCAKCGELMETDRKRHARLCFRCVVPSLLRQNLGDFADSGVWRFGPVVFDWDGEVSVARCDDCSFSILRFGERSYLTAIHHAKLWHDTTGTPRRVLSPLQIAECIAVDCYAIITSSEDFPTWHCAEHGGRATQAAA